MTFASCLKDVLAKPSPTRQRKPLLQALVGLAGLAALPFLSGSSSFAGQGLKVLAALAGASFIAFVALKQLAGRTRAAQARAELRVVSRTSLSQKNAVAIVEADGQRFVLAYGDGFAQVLAARPLEPSPASQQGETR
jgi:flagellar biogenesis protein FliO